jgi:hypothetical protein
MALPMLIEVLKYVGLVALPFTIYFAWKKIGYRVAASYSWRAGPLIASGIGSVTLINMKDRPLAIFGIHAVMDGLSFSLKEFNPPFILKAMEATTIEIPAVTKRRLGREIYHWELPAGRPAAIDIFLSTATKTVKCRHAKPPSQIAFAIKQKLRPICDETNSFNGVLYNDNAKFAITYTEENQSKIALIDQAGVIYWDYAINGLRPHEIETVDTVKAALIRCGLARLISPFAVDALSDDHPIKRTKAAIHQERAAS